VLIYKYYLDEFKDVTGKMIVEINGTIIDVRKPGSLAPTSKNTRFTTSPSEMQTARIIIVV